MDKEKKYQTIIIVLSVVIVILLTLCIFFASGVINFKSNNVTSDKINQKVNIKEEKEKETKSKNSEEQDLVIDNNKSIENIVPSYNDNKLEENSSKQEEKEVIDVKQETWLKLVGGWKTEKMDQPGLNYNTAEEKEKYGDEYAYVYGYLYFASDYKLYYSYCAINKLLRHDDYTIVKVIDASHIDVKNSEHYISTLDENTLIIDGIKFVKNNEIKSTDFYDSNGNYCPSNYHCPIYSK